eukprot:scaffold14733_cov108-Isochrysis_galbana.AAC.2
MRLVPLALPVCALSRLVSLGPPPHVCVAVPAARLGQLGVEHRVVQVDCAALLPGRGVQRPLLQHGHEVVDHLIVEPFGRAERGHVGTPDLQGEGESIPEEGVIRVDTGKERKCGPWAQYRRRAGLCARYRRGGASYLSPAHCRTLRAPPSGSRRPRAPHPPAAAPPPSAAAAPAQRPPAGRRVYRRGAPRRPGPRTAVETLPVFCRAEWLHPPQPCGADSPRLTERRHGSHPPHRWAPPPSEAPESPTRRRASPAAPGSTCALSRRRAAATRARSPTAPCASFRSAPESIASKHVASSANASPSRSAAAHAAAASSAAAPARSPSASSTATRTASARAARSAAAAACARVSASASSLTRRCSASCLATARARAFAALASPSLTSTRSWKMRANASTSPAASSNAFTSSRLAPHPPTCRHAERPISAAPRLGNEPGAWGVRPGEPLPTPPAPPPAMPATPLRPAGSSPTKPGVAISPAKMAAAVYDMPRACVGRREVWPRKEGPGRDVSNEWAGRGARTAVRHGALPAAPALELPGGGEAVAASSE